VTSFVSAKVEPGGSAIRTWVCDRSSGGMKPGEMRSVKSNPIEPALKSSAATSVRKRCFRHHDARIMYAGIQNGSLWARRGGLRM
jgi:hypothetical protein